MPGLINRETRSALPLSVSDVTSCVRGYTLALTASMTYENMEDHAIEGLFLFPLEENSMVVGFEAMICSQIITLQIKDKSKMADCYLEGCSSPGGGHVVMDEDFEKAVLVVNLGLIPPMETVHILVSTSSELITLPSGGIKVSSPPVCTPRVQRSINEEQGLSPNFSRTRDRSAPPSSPLDASLNASQLWLASLLETESINSMDYEFNFQLEIRAPYLLAGVESPSHAIRADADPQARSATSVVITLADKYTYDSPVSILIYPSEPHLPQVLMENGDMMMEEYDEHLRGRSDFIKATRKDSSNQRKVEVIHRRLHKDLLHNPVVMLNFCPDLRSVCPDLTRVHGEFLFLLDRSGSMSGASINRVKDAMVVILKSLVPGCLFNIIGFGSTFKSLFATSQNYEEEALATACDYVRRMRADMGGTNILAPLRWIVRQPAVSGHPRLLFLLTDGAVSNTGRVIETVRSHARHIRCFTFGIGQSACRRLVNGLAAVSRGSAEFLADGERLQPKVLKSLKKTLCPVLSDVTIEWLFPETKEVLLSPAGSSFLFPGDRLIGYSVVSDITRYHDNPKSDKRRRYSMMRSVESSGSVFYHSQEEEPPRLGAEDPGDHRESYPGASMTDCSPVTAEQGIMDAASPRRRAYSTNQILEFNPAKKLYTPSDPASVPPKNPLRRTQVQELGGAISPEHQAHWRNDFQPQLASLCAASSRVPPPAAARTSPQPDETPPPPQEVLAEPPNHENLPTGSTAAEDGSTSTESPSVGSLGDNGGYDHQLCTAETPQESGTAELSAAAPPAGDCKAVVSGLLCGEAVRWEVTFDIQPFLSGREREEKVHEELWNETLHHLAGRSIIRDFEHMAERESEIEHGSGRKYQLYAVQTSKACNILSKYTAFVPIDLDTNEYLQTCIEYLNPVEGVKRNSQSGSRSGSRKNRGYSIGLGRSQSGGVSGEADDAPPNYHGDDGGASPCSTPSSSGWDRWSFAEVCQRSPSVTSDQSQKSVESIFSARLALSRTRLLTRAAKGFMCGSHGKSGDSIGENDNENKDYIPLVLLQLASGAFPLDAALCDAISVPMEKLKWTSPFSRHRSSLNTPSQSADSTDHSCSSPSEPDPDRPAWTDPPSLAGPPADPALSPSSRAGSGRSSGSSGSDPAWRGGTAKRPADPEGSLWATAVALAWLEHSSASFFIEWELVAAKASMWLSAQDVPEGRDLAAIKAAANQLFIILRHWDENLQLNMLCYNPNSM